MNDTKQYTLVFPIDHYNRSNSNIAYKYEINALPDLYDSDH